MRHLFYEGARCYRELAYFSDEDACFSGGDVSCHGEKLRLQTGDPHFQCHISTDKIHFLRKATFLNGETTCLHGEGVALTGQRNDLK